MMQRMPRRNSQSLRAGLLRRLERQVDDNVCRWSFVPQPGGTPLSGGGRDPTDQATLAARLLEAERLATVGRLTAGVAHDFNNLLSVVGLGSQVIESDTAASEMTRECARSMHAAVDHAAALVRRLVAFGGMRPAGLCSLDLNDEVRGFSPLARLVVRSSVTLNVRTTDDPLLVLADTTELGQVLMNLVVNANDAIPDRGQIEVSTGRVEGAGGAMAVLRVTDTGEGIAPDVLPHIFERFFTTKADRGTGVGLSTVSEIVMRHGGRIRVDTSPGRGTTFVVMWPLSAGTSRPSIA